MKSRECEKEPMEEGQRLHTIAHARNGFTDKFGIPHQPNALSHIETRIVFTPSYRVRESLRGIEGFSHLWLIWGFSANRLSGGESEWRWSPTVRPPRLGGNVRVGVFATRSPFRPNGLGLSSVRLLRVEESPREGLVLVVSGADLLDGTPIYDIKPYLSYSDAHPDALDGFAGACKAHRLSVVWCDGVALSDEERAQIEEILAQDPRPAYQHDPQRVYGMDFGGRRVQFRVEGEVCIIVGIMNWAKNDKN